MRISTRECSTISQLSKHVEPILTNKKILERVKYSASRVVENVILWPLLLQNKDYILALFNVRSVGHVLQPGGHDQFSN